MSSAAAASKYIALVDVDVSVEWSRTAVSVHSYWFLERQLDPQPIGRLFNRISLDRGDHRRWGIA